MRNQSNRRGLAVGAGDSDHRNCRLRSRRVEHVDYRRANITWCALRWVRVHPDSGAGVYFDDHCSILPEWNGDVRGQHIDAGDVEPDDARCHLTGGDVIGMHFISSVDRCAAGREISSAAQIDFLILLRHCCEREFLLGEKGDRPVVRRKLGECFGVSDAATRIAILALDQMGNGALTIADYARGNSLGAGDYLAVDNQDTMIASFGGLLDDDSIAVFARIIPCFVQRFLTVDAARDPTPVVRIERLDDDRIPNFLDYLDSAREGACDVALRHG